MGGNSSKLSRDQLIEITQLIQQWANDQDNQTNAAMRTQYNRVTELINQLNQRMNDRQDSIQIRLEKQVQELKEQLESAQKKMSTKDEAGPSGNRINDLLNELASSLEPQLGEKNFQKMPNPPHNFSNQMGPRGFGPAVAYQSYGGSSFGHPAYQGPYGPNPNMAYPPTHPFQQNYHPGLVPYQQPRPRMGPHPVETYYSEANPLQHAQSAPKYNPSKNKGTEESSKGSIEKSKNQKQSLSMPNMQNVNKGAEKSQNPIITKITKRFEESRKETSKISQASKPIKLEDIEKIVAQFKQQHIEGIKEKSYDTKKHVNRNDKHDRNNAKNHDDAAENRDQRHGKRFDKSESGDRRDQYKARGRGKGSHQQWKNKNRQARKKPNSRNINNDELDSDSNESVMSNFSCVSKISSAASANKNIKVFWTTRTNYARDYHFTRARSQIESLARNLNLENYEKLNKSCDEGTSDFTDCHSESDSQDNFLAEEKKDEKKNVQAKQGESTSNNENLDAPSTSSSKTSPLNVFQYPSKEKAISDGTDLQKPFERQVLFVGVTETEEHRTHYPTCLAHVYDLEEKYEHFQLISLI